MFKEVLGLIFLFYSIQISKAVSKALLFNLNYISVPQRYATGV